MLNSLPVSVLYCHRGEDAIKHMKDFEPSLVLLDGDMPGMDGYQVINKMWADDDLRQIPVLLMTSHFSDRKQLLNQPLLEVVDALPKPINPAILVSRVKLALTLRSHQQKIIAVLEDGGQAMRKRHEGVIAVNAQGIVTFVNATGLALLRTNHQMISGVYIESIFEEPNHLVKSAWHQHPIQRMCSQGNILQVESCQLYCADGNQITVKMAAIPMDHDDELSLVIAFRQIESLSTEEDQGQYQDQYQRQADLESFDLLTGTYNRLAFERLIEERIQRNQDKGKKLAVIQIDLAHFNHVNESLGHSVGDRMLKDVVSRIRKSVRPTDRIGRIGGDVFALMVDDVVEPKRAGRVAQKIIKALRERFLLDGFELYIGCSLGISTYPECGIDSGALLKNAAIAVEGAKLLGSNAYQYFTAKMNEEMLARVELESSLHHALERGEFDAEVVPCAVTQLSSQYPADTKVFRLNIRWTHPRFGCATSAELLNLLERHDATHLYQQALTTVLEQFASVVEQDIKLLIPTTLRLLIIEQLGESVAAKMPQMPASSIGWLLHEQGLGRYLNQAETHLKQLQAMGFSIGLSFENGAYLATCLNQLELDYLSLPAQEQSGKAKYLEDALLELAGKLDIAVIR